MFDDDSSFNDSEQTEEQSTITYTVVRRQRNKKRNDSFRDGIEIEEIHHHPTDTKCACCQSQMTEAGSVIAREEAKFIPATMKRIQHIEHAYECKNCKKNVEQKAQIKCGKAPKAVIQRSIAGPMFVLFQSSLSKGRPVLEDFTTDFKGTIISTAILLMATYLILHSLTVGPM